MKTKHTTLKGFVVAPAECRLYGKTHPDCWIRHLNRYSSCGGCPRYISGKGLRADPWSVYPLSNLPKAGDLLYLVVPNGWDGQPALVQEMPSPGQKVVLAWVVVEVTCEV